MQTNSIAAGPSPPDAPTALLLSPSKMEVSWEPPWPHPVNSYLVYVTNTHAGTSLNYSISSTNLTVLKESNDSCYELEFAVLALTDVGPSNLSQTTIKGFSKGISKLNKKCIYSRMSYHSQQVMKIIVEYANNELSPYMHA